MQGRVRQAGIWYEIARDGQAWDSSFHKSYEPYFFWEDGSVFHLKSFEYIVCSFEYLKICEAFVI